MKTEIRKNPIAAVRAKRSLAPASPTRNRDFQLEAKDLLPPVAARRGVSPLARDRASLCARRAMYLPV